MHLGSEQSLHEIIRKHTYKAIITCGNIESLENANKLLKDGRVDLIAFGRSLISNPELVSNFKKNLKFEIQKFNYEKDIDKLT